MTFKTDLIIGKLAEDLVQEKLEKYWGIKFRQTEGNFKGYDLYSPNDISVEVKMDRGFRTTNNVAIEYRYKGHKSGIKTTLATHWVYLLGLDLWLARTSEIISWLYNNHKDCKKVKGGDNRESDLILLTFGQFKQIFTRIDTL